MGTLVVVILVLAVIVVVSYQNFKRKNKDLNEITVIDFSKRPELKQYLLDIIQPYIVKENIFLELSISISYNILVVNISDKLATLIDNSDKKDDIYKGLGELLDTKINKHDDLVKVIPVICNCIEEIKNTIYDVFVTNINENIKNGELIGDQILKDVKEFGGDIDDHLDTRNDTSLLTPIDKKDFVEEEVKDISIEDPGLDGTIEILDIESEDKE